MNTITGDKHLLNLGCGRRYHGDWTNVDFHSTGKGVIAHNLLKGIPFKDNTFDMVYHSHIIEHFPKEEAPKFLGECYRVLKQNGILRVAFPDLEQMVSHYTRLLRELKNGDTRHEADYDWIMLELYDQTVRNVSGGEMFRYFVRESIPNESFVLERCGVEAKNLIAAGKKRFSETLARGRGGDKGVREMVKRLKRKLSRPAAALLGGDSLAARIGKFRLGGEIHQWMYDSFSLGRLLGMTGFKQIMVRDPFTSCLKGWKEYNLDTEPDGTVYKPESAYIEAIK
ncbi:MAG: methyltransferase domain-containing protein [Treponema sp.]|jgi:predicted SAM-dependent methyltransferase|nr:methyltransferase domain-containing protein [Treponema sp.]